MKKLTKNLKHIITGIVCAFVLMNSFNASAQTKTLSDKDIAYVKSEFRKGMVSFVESVKPIYKTGMSFSAFKSSILGKSSRTITSEGDALLLKAYNYISKSTPTNSILKNDSGKELASALKYVAQYNSDNKSNNGDLVLFGNTTGETFPSDAILNSRDGCRWYQLFCHLESLWNWLMADPNGDGINNLDLIIDAFVAICQIFGC